VKKQCIDDLALFGGPPAFAEPLHVGRPQLGNRRTLLRRINEMLDRNWLTNHGPLVAEFERRVAETVGVAHCVAMCNGTVALEIAVRALGLSGEVIVPSMTFVATAHALQWQQITPVFCDIEPDTHTIDPRRVEELITPRTTGILGVHLWGHPCDVEALEEIARRRGLALLFDAAHAFGSSYRGQMIGGFGAAEVFSFHATKYVNAFEGGAVLTNDAELAAKMRLMKNFGFSGDDKVIYIGTNGKMTEVAAAMGLTSLESLEKFRGANERNYRRYRARLDHLEGFRVLPYDDAQRNNYQYVVVEIDRRKTGLTRDQLLRILRAENVLARRYFYPGCHQMEPYRSYYPNARLLLPVTEEVASRVLVLPTGVNVSQQQIETICDVIELALSTAPRAKQRYVVHGPSSGVPPLHQVPASGPVPDGVNAASR